MFSGQAFDIFAWVMGVFLPVALMIAAFYL
jgi:hypothetical protein